jgi:AraC family transcriptional regulator
MNSAIRPVTLRDYQRRLLRVLVHVQQHLDEPLALSDLAALACFSPYHFHRIFRGMVGESVKEYVRRLRLERAAGRLKAGELPVTEIALEAGYEGLEAFSRSFRSAFGTSPSRFRTEHRFSTSSPAVVFQNADRWGDIVPPWKIDGKPNGDARRVRQEGDSMKVKIERLDPIRVAFMRHVGPYDKVGPTWDKLMTYLGKEGWLGGNLRCIGLCHDDPEVTPADKIRYDACVEISEAFEPIGEIGVQVIAGGDYAVTTHFGSYNKLGDTYARLLGQWVPRSGRELRSAPCFEVYLNDPGSTRPADLLTDIYAPLARSPARRPANARRKRARSQP